MNLPFAIYNATPDTSEMELIGQATYSQDAGLQWEDGFLPRSGLVGVCDELPRIPSATANVFLQPASNRKMSLPNIVIENGRGRMQGRKTVDLPAFWTLIGTGNPSWYGGTATRNEALYDRFGIGYDQEHPEREARLAMLQARVLVNPPVFEIKPLPVTLHEIQAALSHVIIQDNLLKLLLNASYLASPPTFRKRIRYTECYLDELPRLQQVQKKIRQLEQLTEENLVEGGNPRGEELMQLCAIGHALLDGRLRVNIEDLAFAARSALRFRLKPYPGCDEMVPVILEQVIDIVFSA
jgi:MoxR-like ATPase